MMSVTVKMTVVIKIHDDYDDDLVVLLNGLVDNYDSNNK